MIPNHPPDVTNAEELINNYRPMELIQAHIPINGAWQKCPVCNGHGKVYSEYAGTVNKWTDPCPTCKGTRIISVLTGLPPTTTGTPATANETL